MRKATLVLLACFAGSCVYSSALETDKFTGERRLRATLGSWIWSSAGTLDIRASSAPTPQGVISILTVAVHSSDWVFVEAGPSLMLRLDGHVVTLTSADGSRSSRTVTSGTGAYASAGILETASYDVSIEVLARMAKSKEVIGRIQGARRTVDFTLAPSVLASCGKYLNDLEAAGFWKRRALRGTATDFPAAPAEAEAGAER